MTVTGVTSADVATASYVPPFKYVTSYAPAPLVTGTVTGAIPNNPTASISSDSDYAWTYLQSHMMSSPSYRWAYLLWMILALIALLYAFSHHVRLSGGSLGLAYARWGMKRHTFGTKKKGIRNRALPSNSVLVTFAVIGAITCVLCVIGSDYIAPSSSVLDFGTSFRKRASSSPTYTISKAFWTSGSRFGFMAFALLPLVVLLALKAPPVALLALRPLSHLYADKLAVFHRAAGWLVWGLTTIHVVLWTIQLFKDSYNGRATWLYLWGNYRFIFGCVAYFCMTAIMVFSLRPIRKHRYEFFYIAHIVFVILTLACSAVHHPVLWYWIAAAGGLWLAERAWRFSRFARINGFFTKARPVPRVVAGMQYSDLTTNEATYEMKKSSEFNYTDKTLPRLPGAGAGVEGGENEFGPRSTSGYYDEGSLQPLGSYDSRYHDYITTADSAKYDNPQGYFPTDPYDAPQSSNNERQRSSIATLPVNVNVNVQPPPPPPPIPVGYAHAQLLPSRTVRLTIRPAHPFKWSPGQSVLLYLPELSRFQSHPFTILNNDDTEIVLLVKARKGLTRKLFNLVRQRTLRAMGMQADKDKRFSLNSMATGQGIVAPPIHLRALLDGPHGSAGRVNWSNYSTIVIICGGSGVSFGIAVCDWVCKAMASNAGRGIKTQRVRFCWVAREYAEIAWIANQLNRLTTLVPPDRLEISIFVTHASHTTQDVFAPPRPGFAGPKLHERRGSADSVASEMSVDMPVDPEPDETVDSHLLSNYSDIVDLTNYEDEEDVDDPAEQKLSERLQQQGKVRRAKSRKARKRQEHDAGYGVSRGMAKSPTYPPNRASQPSLLAYDESEQDQHQQQQLRTSTSYGRLDARLSSSQAAAANSTSDNYNYNYVQPNRPFSADSRRQSSRSLADSTYGRYDPFSSTSGIGMAGRGTPSPSPSLFFPQDDAQSITGESVRNLLARTSRTQSMVLLEESAGGDAGLWIDEADHRAMQIVSEFTTSGKPKLGKVLEEELERATGQVIVATCGPVTLNTVVRNLVSKHISPSRMRHGDKRGHVAIYSEDYEA